MLKNRVNYHFVDLEHSGQLIVTQVKKTERTIPTFMVRIGNDVIIRNRIEQILELLSQLKVKTETKLTKSKENV